MQALFNGLLKYQCYLVPSVQAYDKATQIAKHNLIVGTFNKMLLIRNWILIILHEINMLSPILITLHVKINSHCIKVISEIMD